MKTSTEVKAVKENRIYAVTNVGVKVTDQNTTRLIEASSKAAALAYAVRTTLTVELASQKDLVLLIGDGVEVEVAGEAT